MRDSKMKKISGEVNHLSRREFALAAATTGIFGWTADRKMAWAEKVAALGKSDESPLPARPREEPLNFSTLGAAFDSYMMDEAHGVNRRTSDGRQFFTSALEANEDGGLTTYSAVALGRELSGHGLEGLARSLSAYYSDAYGVFLDSVGATLCEYWYLMNIQSMAMALIELRFPQDAVWLKRVERSMERLQAMAHQIHYDFNTQGYDFAAGAPFTKQDIYRQPDAIGGYAYVMLLGWKLTGKDFCLQEARQAIKRYLDFSANPWYEVPSGAMAVLAAAQLEAAGTPIDAHRALEFVLDAHVGLMATGEWNGCAVDGLMAGFRTEPEGQVYSMESLVTLPYLIPAVRYRPEFATSIARLGLNVAANLRWFYPHYLPADKQSRPDIAVQIPYERLNRQGHNRSPYAEGDYAGHRSIYGGAYALWMNRMMQRVDNDPWMIRWDLSATNFLDRSLPPAFLYYNPDAKLRRIQVALPPGTVRVRELCNRHDLPVKAAHVELELPPHQARVVEFATKF